MKRVLSLCIVILVFCGASFAEEKIGLEVGEKAPDFKVQTHFGEEIQLSKALSKGPVVLVFYRGGWCPYCNLQLKELQNSLPEIQQLGATLIAVSVDTPENAQITASENELAFPIISNSDADLLEDYHLTFYVADDLAQKYLNEYKINLVAASGRDDYLIAIPATFVINSEGLVTYAYVDKNYKVRPSTEDILKALQALNGQSGTATEEDSIELSLCSDEKLGVSFYCNGDWGLETEDETLFIVIKEEDPSLTVTMTKSEAPVLSLKQLTNSILKAMGNYAENFTTTMVQIDGRDAIRVDGFAEGDPDILLSDYYVIDEFELYAILFSLSPKEEWPVYEDLTTTIISSFKFPAAPMPKAL